MRDKIMKSLGLVTMLTFVFTFSGLVLGQSLTKTVVISRQAKLGGQAIAPGKYTVAFDDKKDGELRISKDDREVLKAAYKIVELSKAPSDSAVVFTAGPDGSFIVRRFEMKGSKVALQFE